MRFFLDFDDVLFNTKKFKKDLIAIFLSHGITEEQFNKSSYWGDKYALNKQIDFLRYEYDIDVEKLKKDLDLFLNNLQKYVFSDVIDLLKYLGRDNIFLVSYGEKETQMQKIIGSGVDKYLKKIVIADTIKSAPILDIINKLSLKDCNNYFIDDRLKYIEEVKKNIISA